MSNPEAGGTIDPNTPVAISYLRLRQLIGWIGILLPFVLLFAAKLTPEIGLQPSISAYYHTEPLCSPLDSLGSRREKCG